MDPATKFARLFLTLFAGNFNTNATLEGEGLGAIITLHGMGFPCLRGDCPVPREAPGFFS